MELRDFSFPLKISLGTSGLDRAAIFFLTRIDDGTNKDNINKVKEPSQFDLIFTTALKLGTIVSVPVTRWRPSA